MANRVTTPNKEKPDIVTNTSVYTRLSNLESNVSVLPTQVNLGLKADKTDVGDKTQLTTTDKTSLVNAINENVSHLAEKANQTDLNTTNATVTNNTAAIGTLSQLNTTDKTSLVNALKEVKSQSSGNQSQIQSLSSGSPKGVYATVSALQTAFPTGNTNIYVVTADGKWYYWNGSAWTAGGTYLNQPNVATSFDFHKQTDGWLTLNRGTDFTWTEGQALLNDGTITTSGANNASLQGVTGFIPISGYTHVNALIFTSDFLPIVALAFYDSNSVFISSYKIDSNFSSSYQLIAIPVNATQIRYSYSTDARADSLSRPRLSNIQLYNANSIGQTQTNIQNDVTTLKNRYTQSDNLFDKSKVTNSGFQLATDGNLYADSTKCITDYIPVTNGDIFNFLKGSVESVIFYDSNKARISSTTWNMDTGQTQTVSVANVAYLRTNVLLTNLDTFMVSKTPISIYKPYLQLPFTFIQHYNNGAMDWWRGKNGDSLGDSLTGQGFYQSYTKKYFNLAKFSNHGIGGTKLSGAANANGDSMWMDSRINSLDVDADFITVMGGANDGVSAVVGDLTLENVDTNTYAGALNVLLSKLYYKYQKLSAGYFAGVDCSGVVQVPTTKNILIFVCTPFYMPSETNHYTKTLANAVREICKLWGIPVVDYAAKSGLNSGVANVYWGVDRTHPLEIGHSDRLVPVLIGEMEHFKPVDYTKAYYI